MMRTLGYCPHCGRVLAEPVWDYPAGVVHNGDYHWEGSLIPELWRTNCCDAETERPYQHLYCVVIPSV